MYWSFVEWSFHIWYNNPINLAFIMQRRHHDTTLYTRRMGHIWSERNEFDTMLLVETLASEAQAELGVIPKEAAKAIREKGNFDVERIHEIEKETNHDIISFVTAVGEYVGPEAAKYIHLVLPLQM